MKKTMFIIAACAFAAVSCQKEMAVERGTGSEGILTVTANIAQFDADTKTSIDGTATTIKPLWKEGDEIKLFATDGASAVYVLNAEDAGKASGTFTIKDQETPLSGTFACAYYPAANATAYTDGTGITATIPDTQAYTANSFANGAFPMVGTGTLNAEKANLDLTFKNVFGLVQLNFTGSETITKIDLVSASLLTGTATITADGNCTTTLAGGNKQVSLTFENPVTLATGTATAFYIAVPASCTVSKVYVTTKNGNNTSLMYKANDITPNRSQIKSLNSATLSGAGFTSISYSEATDTAPVVAAGIVWAPVNCGYHATNYKYGKMYQWGRAVGGGYDDGATFTETVYQIAETSASVSDITPNTNPVDNVFYLGKADNYDWYIHTSDKTKQLQSWPMKQGDAGYVAGKIDNPCPEGWRVPTSDEFGILRYTDWDSAKQSGTTKRTYTWDSTNKTGTINGITFLAPGYRGFETGAFFSRGISGCYWSSTVATGTYQTATYLYIGGYSIVAKYNRANGNSVRCVQE